MEMFRLLSLSVVLALTLFPLIALAETSTVVLSLEEKEEFLQNGKILSMKSLSTGTTNSRRAKLEYNGVIHNAHIQTINESKHLFQSLAGSEMNFRDYYGFNIAAYKLDKLLGLNMTPPSVERKVEGERAAVTWWVDDVAMMELDRVRNNIQPPDPVNWAKQACIVHIINELIYDTDANMGNLLITKDWKIWMVDRTRAFRRNEDLQNPKNLTHCERRLLSKLRDLNQATLEKELGNTLNKAEIEGLEARRRLIVAYFDTQIAAQGEAAVLFDLPGRN